MVLAIFTGKTSNVIQIMQRRNSISAWLMASTVLHRRAGIVVWSESDIADRKRR
jgi:hypothetical protein